MMKSTITVRGPVTVTYLRNGGVRIEAGKRRARMHLRADEFMQLIHAAARAEPVRVAAVDARFGAL
jgi:hypothetical protein